MNRREFMSFFGKALAVSVFAPNATAIVNLPIDVTQPVGPISLKYKIDMLNDFGYAPTMSAQVTLSDGRFFRNYVGFGEDFAGRPDLVAEHAKPILQDWAATVCARECRA